MTPPPKPPPPLRTRSAGAPIVAAEGAETLETQNETADPTQETVLHASCVALDGRALLILGASGSGKSSLALDMIALGACLVADDRTVIRRDGHRLTASCPPTIEGRIEARYVGLLRLPSCPEADVTYVMDLDRTETERLPPPRHMRLLGQSVTLLYRPPGLNAAGALFHCLKDRRETP
ncbi:HPr kinase/phosphorylase [Tropicimonas isoalkanivorans]|uniref:Hpr(Ser) kinase/phosphatase n=1 Tax=Tropicimonas isoalkanivorans TaxID=441112 RepID=A0A1I1PMX5_9RHOB|nr:HPr kinase/phosphatase C-terminal domain-containing protein [Tropicimonas isoalkanivorans]SFD07370.1 Hpr(Ser) kinase/phosphatase [Tropicimonas isoalkanivorans]